jgi:DNA (cytosine-5)-methyltransferase 1
MQERLEAPTMKKQTHKACLTCGIELAGHTGKGRKPRYCSATCKQKDYRSRQKRNEFQAQHLLRNYKHLPVLSLFPGIGLLDMAFEELGFLVVRGPDLLWGGDIKTFHPTKGYFQGMIAGPPCQSFSRLKYFVEYNGYETAPNLIPEFERCVREAQPVWFLMENVAQAPLPCVSGYQVHSQIVNNRWYGGVQNRQRRISFGTRDGLQLLIPRQKEARDYAPAVCASGYYRDETDPDSPTGYTSKKILKRMMELQGLPEDFVLSGMTIEGATKAVGNGVPLHMGRALAKAVKEAIQK